MHLPYTLANLQVTDITAGFEAGRFGLFNEVGCGKTVCATAMAMMWNNERNIVIMPPILIDQWERWLKRVNETDVSVFRGPRRTASMLEHQWVLMSHAVFRDSYASIVHATRNKRITIMVDEAQALKNPQSKLFKNVNALVAPDNNLVLMTATPTTKPEDSYAYVKVKTPEIYRSFRHWENMHVAGRDIFERITGYLNLDMLADNFGMKSVKRTKKEVYGDTLSPIWDSKPYRLSPQHQRLYEKLANEQLLLLPDGGKIDATTAQRLRHAMQQIVLNFGHFSGNPGDRSSAFDLIDDAIEQVDPMKPGNSKLVIWTYYKMSSAAVTRYLTDKFGAKAVAAAYGDTNSQRAVDRIMFDDSTRFLVAQPTSVGAGLELQFVCHTMLFIEMSTVPMHLVQAAGRVDRPGQKTRPTIWWGHALDTIQVKLLKTLLDNGDLVAQVERTKTSLRDEIFGRG